jgi:hypothetical protein
VALIALTGALATLTGIALGRVRARLAGEETVEVDDGEPLAATLATEEGNAR